MRNYQNTGKYLTFAAHKVQILRNQFIENGRKGEKCVVSYIEMK